MIPPLVLADTTRTRQFGLIGSTRRLFGNYQTWVDDDSISWAGVRHGNLGFGATWLGPAWVFDPYACSRRGEKLAEQQRKMRSAGTDRHQRKLRRVLRQMRLGTLSERLLWIIHHRVLLARRSVIRLPDHVLATTTWSQDRSSWPRHWRSELLLILSGLCWLHVSDWTNDEFPHFGENTALLTHVADLRNQGNDTCGDDCPGHQGPPHHHYLINIGRGFLGSLEQFAGNDNGTGIRHYAFSIEGRQGNGATLRRVGESGRLQSVFMPAKVGEPTMCKLFTSEQHRLLQAILREIVRVRKLRKQRLSDFEILAGNSILDFHGRRRLKCSLLSPTKDYVTFAGNKKRRELGYLLTSEGGWCAKAGYALTDGANFLHDLDVLSDALGLIAVGVSRDRHFSLKQMRSLAGTAAGKRTLEELHIRVYSEADFLPRWTLAFQEAESVSNANCSTDGQVAELLSAMRSQKVSQRALATAIRADPSFVSKLFRGEKTWPSELLQKAMASIADLIKPKSPSWNGTGMARKPSKVDPNSLLDEAHKLLEAGWSIVPQSPGAKKPLVKWKPYQDRLPSAEEVNSWFERWPNAGLALVLGPLSGIFVVDVDGQEAHEALVKRLGKSPKAPKVLSGSGEPYRYHLYFRHPSLVTKAKSTPWHPSLEFRGHRGIVIIPPSLHSSGGRYAWVEGHSPSQEDLPELPRRILEALSPAPTSSVWLRTPANVTKLIASTDASPRTLDFLRGKFADGPRWNDRLFAAACDLCGRDMPFKKAEPLLLSGAKPWNRGEEELARRTIQSAYSRKRDPGQL